MIHLKEKNALQANYADGALINIKDNRFKQHLQEN